LESVREASVDDIGSILQLIEPFERDGTLVKRSRTEIERDIHQYTVVEHDGVIFGCAALYPYPEAKTAEMPALTVSPHSQRQGGGHLLAPLAGPGRRREAAQAQRTQGPRNAARQHLRANNAHHALVHQARLPAGQPRVAARGPQEPLQLGPAQPGAGQVAAL